MLVPGSAKITDEATLALRAERKNEVPLSDPKGFIKCARIDIDIGAYDCENLFPRVDVVNIQEEIAFVPSLESDEVVPLGDFAA